MSEAVVEQPRWYRKRNAGLNGELPYSVRSSTHSEDTSNQMDDRTNNIVMEQATGSAVEHTSHSRGSTTVRSRRLDSLRVPGDGTATALEQMPRGVAQRTRSRVSRPLRGRGLDAISEERMSRGVLILQGCNEQRNSLQRSEGETVIPQTSARGTSMSSTRDGEVSATHSQATDENLSRHRSRVGRVREEHRVVRDIPYTRVRLASAPRSHVRDTVDTRSHSGETRTPAARGREAGAPARNGRGTGVVDHPNEAAASRQPCPRLRPRSQVSEANNTHSRAGEASASASDGDEADDPARNGRGTSVTDEHNEAAGGRQPCPRLRPRTSANQYQRRGMRRNSSNEEREPYSLRPRVERPNYSVTAGNRRTTQPNWPSQLRTQMRQYMDEIFAAYVNAMLFGNQKREVKDLPEVSVTEEHVHSGLKCSVCLLDFVLDEVVHKLPCDHLYHKNCIIPWLEQNDNCPMCRRPVEDDESGDDDILPDDDDDDDDSGNQRARFRIVVGDADVTVIAHDSGNETSSASDSDFELFMNTDDY